MTLKELQENLKFLVDEGLQVRVFTDHDQVSISSGGVGIGYIDEDTYMAESIHPDDIDDESVQVVEIWGLNVMGGKPPFVYRRSI